MIARAVRRYNQMHNYKVLFWSVLHLYLFLSDDYFLLPPASACALFEIGLKSMVRLRVARSYTKELRRRRDCLKTQPSFHITQTMFCTLIFQTDGKLVMYVGDQRGLVNNHM